MLYDRELDPRIERSRFANALVYLDETRDGVRSHKVSLTIAAGQYVYDLIRSRTTDHIVRQVGASLLSGWSILEGSGPAGCDQIEFTVASLPPNGAEVTVQYKKFGQPEGIAYGKRAPIEVDEESDVREFECEGWESVFHIAGFEEVFNDPAWYWVLIDVNPGLNGIWRAMLSNFPNGTKLIYPVESEVLIQLEGLLDE